MKAWRMPPVGRSLGGTRARRDRLAGTRAGDATHPRRGHGPQLRGHPAMPRQLPGQAHAPVHARHECRGHGGRRQARALPSHRAPEWSARPSSPPAGSPKKEALVAERLAPSDSGRPRHGGGHGCSHHARHGVAGAAPSGPAATGRDGAWCWPPLAVSVRRPWRWRIDMPAGSLPAAGGPEKVEFARPGPAPMP